MYKCGYTEACTHLYVFICIYACTFMEIIARSMKNGFDYAKFSVSTEITEYV